MWKWCRLAKNVEYSKQKTSHAEYQRSYCFKCLPDGIDSEMGSVVDRDSTQGTSSMTNHISKYRAGEERLLFCRRKSVVPSSQKGIREVPRLAKFKLLCRLSCRFKLELISPALGCLPPRIAACVPQEHIRPGQEVSNDLSAKSVPSNQVWTCLRNLIAQNVKLGHSRQELAWSVRRIAPFVRHESFKIKSS